MSEQPSEMPPQVPNELSPVLGTGHDVQELKSPMSPELGGQAIIERIKRAQEIMSKDFLGPEAIAKAFPGITLETKNIPNIPFSKEDLLRAKELGQCLILHVDKAPDGAPMTMQKIIELRQGMTGDGKKLLYSFGEQKQGMKSNAWYANEEFFTTTPLAL